jgi:hypothetical protein
MEPIVAKCGYRCDLCLSHEANLKSDEDRLRMSDAMLKYYQVKLAPEAIKPCKGCLASRKPPDKECPVWYCVEEKGIENCGHCEDFGCDNLKERMDTVESFLEKASNVPQEDYQLFFKPYLSRATLMEIRNSLPKSKE